MCFWINLANNFNFLFSETAKIQFSVKKIGRYPCSAIYEPLPNDVLRLQNHAFKKVSVNLLNRIGFVFEQGDVTCIRIEILIC